MANVKARCKHEVSLWIFKLKTSFPNPGWFPPMFWIRGEITGDFCLNRCTPMHSLQEPNHHWTTISSPFWTLTPMSIGLSREDFIHCPFGHRKVLRPIPVLQMYVNFHLGWKAERGHWSLVSLSSSPWLSPFLFSLPLFLSFFLSFLLCNWAAEEMEGLGCPTFLGWAAPLLPTLCPTQHFSKSVSIWCHAKLG